MLIALWLALGALSVAGPGRAEEFPGGVRDSLGPLHDKSPAAQNRPSPRGPRDDGAAGRLRHWNEIAVATSALDHTPVAPGERRVFGEQMGPGRMSRALAIVHIAMFDAVNAVEGGYRSYSGLPPASAGTSVEAAIAQAAHDTLTALFPSQAAGLGDKLTDDLRRIRAGRPKTDGIDLGRRAAVGVLAARAGDGSAHAEARVGQDYVVTDAPGMWQPDPVSGSPMAMGMYWGDVAPFVLESGGQFRVPPPPALGSPAYARAYNEVRRLGGDGVTTRTARTPDQTIAGIYWGYDGTPGLGAPPALYNQIAVHIAAQRGTRLVELARLLALVNVAMADAGIAIWDSKYHYEFWRPVTGIREGADDGNRVTEGDPGFMPLGAPASNLTGPNFTPPFPAYPSGHAGFGAALFQVLRRFYGTDSIAFTFVSDEYNGQTLDNDGNVRPLIPRRFRSLSEAEEENGQSRIYLGIHWAFDKTAGIAQGRGIADYVFDHAFVPVPRSRR